MEFCKKLLSEHPEIIEELGLAPKVEERWYRCPFCRKALFPFREDTRIEHMPFRCKACKKDFEVNVFPLKMNNLR